MAQDIKISGASYTDVPAVDFPTVGGDTARFVDTSDANAAAGDIAQGRTAYVGGVKLTGTNTGGGGGTGTQFLITVTEDDGVYTPDKTYAEALAAYNAGELLIMRIGQADYYLKSKYSQGMSFSNGAELFEGAFSVESYQFRTSGEVSRYTESGTLPSDTEKAAWNAKQSAAISDAGGYFGTDTVEGALQELGARQNSYWLPSVDASGNISWTLSASATVPTRRNIRGPQGAQGIQGPQGPAYVLTSADKTEIKNAVLAEIPYYDGSVS